MQRSIGFEWIGFIIVIVSVIAYGWVRTAYLNNAKMETVTLSLMLLGALITIIAFIVRKKKK